MERCAFPQESIGVWKRMSLGLVGDSKGIWLQKLHQLVPLKKTLVECSFSPLLFIQHQPSAVWEGNDEMVLKRIYGERVKGETD